MSKLDLSVLCYIEHTDAVTYLGGSARLTMSDPRVTTLHKAHCGMDDWDFVACVFIPRRGPRAAVLMYRDASRQEITKYDLQWFKPGRRHHGGADEGKPWGSWFGVRRRSGGTVTSRITHAPGGGAR